MYSYTFDEQTGGLLLNTTPTVFSKEPRPVYAPELDLLGFDKYWNYDKQSNTPYMWAESVNYWYRGKQVARLKGGDLYHAPEIILATDENGKIVNPEPEGTSLKPIDLNGMIEANRDIMDIIEGTTVRKIVSAYEKYHSKVDIFHVAFSGGKDSAVLLDLVKKALPKRSFVVVFGDTGMEFPDTYEVIEHTKAFCEKEEIPFYLSKAHFDPISSWNVFGPPSRTLRWCCSVHKSTPQTIKLREITGKNDYTGLDFVGVRKHESVARSEYEFENYSKKQKGQYSFNAILEWTSAEIWLYIYTNGLIINGAYKKGNSRAGCLLCPMSGGLSNYVRRQSYTDNVDVFADIIAHMNVWDAHSKTDMKTYLTSGGWDNRRSGRGLRDNFLKYQESVEGGKISFHLIKPSSNWKEWIKTVEPIDFDYSVEEQSDGVVFTAFEKDVKANPGQGKLFRQALRKSAYCIGCKVCETNCKNGRIHFVDGKVTITDCLHCHECHDLPGGCLMYNSLKISQGEKKMKTVNCFDDHAPKYEWFVSFFDDEEGGEQFMELNGLGPNQFTHFKRYLRDAGLIDKGNNILPFYKLIKKIGWETETAQALLLINLVNENPQMEWYVTNLEIGQYYERPRVEDMLMAEDLKEKAARSVAKSFARLVDSPMGRNLLFGYVTEEQDIIRTKCNITDNRVVLYALLRFSEKCNNYKEFTLAWLMNDSIDRDGISPIQIFGLDYEDAKSILLGLSAKYPDYIDATFTNDLDKITIKDKTAEDVLVLFEEEM